MKISSFPKLYELGLKFPRTVLLIAGLLSLAGLHFAGRLVMLTDFRSLLPKSAESVKNLELFEENFGNFSQLVISFESPDPELSKKFKEVFSERLLASPEIDYVEGQRPVEYFQKRQWLFLDLPDLQEVERRIDRALRLENKGVSPAFSHLMDFADEEDRAELDFDDIKEKYTEKFNGEVKKSEGEAGDLQILWVKPKLSPKDLSYNREFMERVRQMERELRQDPALAEVKVGYAGEYQNSLEQLAHISKEIAWVSTVVTLLLFAILILYFRRLSSALLIGLPLACSVLWTMGLLYFILGHLNLITGFGAAILAGLGSDYGIFLLSRYDHEKAAGRSFAESCQLAFANTGRATFGSMVTTVGAFLALIFSKFGIFVEFGILGAIGLLMNYLGMMLLLPALLALGERWKNRGWFKKLSHWDRRVVPTMGFLSSGVQRLFMPKGAWLGIVLVILLAGASFFTLSSQGKIYFEDGQMDTQELPANKLYSRISQANWGTVQPGVLLAHGAAEEEATLHAMESVIAQKAPEARVFHKVLGISSFIPKHQDEKREQLARILEKLQKGKYLNPSVKAKTLKSIEDTLASDGVHLKNLPEEVRRVFLDKTGKDLFAIFLYPSLPRSGSDNIQKYYQGILDAKTASGLSFAVVDPSFIELDILNLIRREAGRGMGLILVFFAGFLLLTVRPAGRAMLIFLNLLASLLLLSAALWLAKIPLNVMNIAMIPIVLGTGIDCFIHFSHRFDEEGAVAPIVRSEIPAIFVSSLTSIVGFGGLVLTSSVGLRSVGWVAVIGLSIVTLMCALLFPRCLALREKKKATVPASPKTAVA